MTKEEIKDIRERLVNNTPIEKEEIAKLCDIADNFNFVIGTVKLALHFVDEE